MPQRVTFITELARAGNSPIAVQKLARHSDFNLTLRTYTRLQIDDLVDAVERLSSLTGGDEIKTPATTESGTEDDVRLRSLVEAWPSLPEHIKTAIALLTAPQIDPAEKRPR